MNKPTSQDWVKAIKGADEARIKALQDFYEALKAHNEAAQVTHTA
jgi:hypothetical protein